MCRDPESISRGSRRDDTERLGRLSVGPRRSVLDVDSRVELVVSLARLEGTIDRLVVGRSVVLATDAIEDVLAPRFIERLSSGRVTRGKNGSVYAGSRSREEEREERRPAESERNSHGVTELVRGVACLQAEHSSAHEVVPLDDLLVGRSRTRRSIRRAVCSESVREDEASERVTALIRTVRVLLELPRVRTRLKHVGSHSKSYHFSSVIRCVNVDLRLVNLTDDLNVVRGLSITMRRVNFDFGLQ